MHNLCRKELLAIALAPLLLTGCGEGSQTSPTITKDEAVNMASDATKDMSQDEIYAAHIERKMNEGKTAAEIAKDEAFFAELRANRAQDEFSDGFSKDEDVTPAAE